MNEERVAVKMRRGCYKGSGSSQRDENEEIEMREVLTMTRTR